MPAISRQDALRRVKRFPGHPTLYSRAEIRPIRDSELTALYERMNELINKLSHIVSLNETRFHAIRPDLVTPAIRRDYEIKADAIWNDINTVGDAQELIAGMRERANRVGDWASIQSNDTRRQRLESLVRTTEQKYARYRKYLFTY